MNLFELFVKIGVKDEATKNIEGISSKLGNGLKTAAKIGTAAVGAAAAGIVALTKAAVENYAEYEQLVGGVDTLFKDASQKVQKYASEAYRTSGMSANDYMANATAFSASLISALGDDTEAAAEYANRAMVSMSDNANKMGTSLDSIVQTYQSLARGNFAMLDNLKLGYGGTKAELERLIKDAASYTDIQKKMGITVDASSTSFDNIVNAIAVVQGKLDIAGATALEAGTTIEGSVNSMKAAWDNLVTGVADKNADLEGLINSFVTTIVGDGTENNLGVLGNIMPAVKTALKGAAKLIEGAAPKIIEILPGLAEQLIPSLISATTGMVNAVVAVLPDLLNTVVGAIIDNAPILMDAAIALVSELVGSVLQQLPKIVALGLDLIVSLANGIASNLPVLIPTIIDVILKIVDVLTNQESITKLLKAAFSIITELAWGLIKNIDKIIDAAMTLLDGMIDFFLRPANLAMLIETAIQLVLALGTGIIKAIPQLLVSVGSLIASIFANFATADWASIGTNLVAGLKKGISNAWANLKSWFRGLFGDLIGVAKKILGIASPSTVFRDQVGKNIVLGITEGIDKNHSRVFTSLDKTLTNSKNKLLKTMNFAKTGEKVTEQISSAIDKSKDRVQNTAEKLTKLISDTMADDKSKSQWKQTAETLADTFSNAMNTRLDNLKTSAIEKISAITKSAQQSLDEIVNARTEMQNKLSDVGELFTVDKEGNVLLGNLQSQINEVKNYSNNLSKLSQFVSDDLLSAITEMSVEDAQQYMSALLNLNEQDLRKYDALFTKKLDVSRKAAKKYYKPYIAEVKTELSGKIESIFASLEKTLSETGTNAIEGFLKGFTNKNKKANETIKSFVNSLVKSVKKELGIKSPSRVFMNIANQMVNGLIYGWDKAIGTFEDDVTNSLAFDDGYIGTFGGVNLNGADGYMSRDINIVQNIYSQAKTAAELMREARWQAKMEVLTSV